MSDVTSYDMVSEADFRPRKSTDTVSFTLGQGGAQANADSYLGLAAPIHLPHGAVVTVVAVYFTCDDPTIDVSITVNTRIGISGYVAWGNYRSGGVPPAGGLAEVRPRDLNSMVADNSRCEWTLLVVPTQLSGGPKAWGDKLVVHKAVVAYTLPG